MRRLNLSRIEIIALVLVILLGIGLAVAGQRAQQTIILISSLVLALLWCLVILLGKPDLHLSFFILFAVIISFGVLSEVPFFWSTIFLCLDFAAWNLGEFLFRLRSYQHIHNRKQLENQHLKQLGITLGIGCVLALLTSLVNVDIPFLLMGFLLLAAIALLGFGLRALRPKEEDF